MESSSTLRLSPDEDTGMWWYACVLLEGEARGVDAGDSLGWRVIPLTLEGYVLVPRAEWHQFSDSMDDNL